jgi:trk system potassium uptake protein TrkH
VVSVSVISLMGVDCVTVLSAAATTMGGVGSGLGDVGPMDNYLWMAPTAKVMLTFDMLAGRLEMVTLMVMLTPAFWRR